MYERMTVGEAHAKNRQVERTRSWIWEALMQLMDKKPYEKITVQDITEKAGIARQTFYYNYTDKDDVICQRLDPCFGTRREEDAKAASKTGGRSRIVVVLNQGYIEANRDIIKRFMTIPSLINRVILATYNTPLNVVKLLGRKMSEESDEDYQMRRLQAGYQIAGALRIIIYWFTTDMKMPAEKLVDSLNAMCSQISGPGRPRTQSFRNIPQVVVRIEG
jgi:AcrR family transcriptional regulator